MWNILSYNFLIFILFAGVVTTGCAVKTFVPVTMPAKAGEVLEFRKVAVFDFSTDKGVGNKNGNAYSSAFETEITGVTLDGKKLFTVLDRRNIDKVLQEQKFQMTLADENSVIQLGKLLGASGIWTGAASENYGFNTWYESETYCAIYDNGTCVRYNSRSYQCISQDIVLNVTPKLTDISSGKVVYSTKFTGGSSYRSCKYNLSGINRGELWNNAIQNILNQFRKEIAPYIKLIKVEIMTSDKGIEDEKKLRLFKDGIKYMKNNKVSEACVAWREAGGSVNTSMSLYYNIAICDEIKENYLGAMEKLNLAKKLTTKDNELIESAINRNSDNLKYQKKVQEQLAK